MISFYSGTPGSGKSMHVAKDIYNRLLIKKKPVICSFFVDVDYISRKGKRRIGEFSHVNIENMSAQFFIDYALKNHVMGVEGQTLVVIDECQRIFNPREFSRNDRLEWINFFTQHRHLGFDFILISQFDMLVDKQIRCLFEYDIKHRKLNSVGIFRYLPFISVFSYVTYWYCIKKKVCVDFFLYNKKYSKIYNSFEYFERLQNEKSCGNHQKSEVAFSGDSAQDNIIFDTKIGLADAL